MNAADYDDLAIEEQWCTEARSDVTNYLTREGVAHGQVGEWPAWHVAPVVSVWAIESIGRLGSVGWWVICGDLPTDYISADMIKHPRAAVRAFAVRWLEYAVAIREGERPADFSIGGTTRPGDRLSLLERRAKVLSDWADDDSIWEGP